MKRLIACLVILLDLVTVAHLARAKEHSFDFSRIEPIVREEIQAGNIPGAVVLVGRGEEVLYRQAFGDRALTPAREAMTADTIFDLASLTKVIFTTTAILQLAERGKIVLDAPVAGYWPAFARNGKEAITVRQLLTHTSGLPDGIPLTRLKNRKAVLKRLAEVKTLTLPGQAVEYSDANFAVLGELIVRVSGQSMPKYAENHLIKPLQLHDTGFMPDAGKRRRIAPVNFDPKHIARGVVHDPLARALGRAAGHAGLFGTADDLAVFAHTLLSGGKPLLAPSSVEQLFALQTPPNNQARSLGWRLNPLLAANRAALPPIGAASHLGFTGTGLWLDPIRGVYLIILSNRLHPKSAGDAGPLRAKLVDAISEALGPVDPSILVGRFPSHKEMIAPFVPRPGVKPILTGIDVLAEERFAELQGKRLGLLTHRSGVDGRGRRTVDVLFRTQGISLVSLFSPEHGLGGDREGKIEDTTDLVTGLTIHSLYGATRRPRPEWLDGLDAIVVDLQDAGVRFYTYAATLGYLLEAAAERHLPVYVLDRPNPIRADIVQGPVLDPERTSFTGYWPLPVRHGMTLGELARLFVGEKGIAADLRVVAMRNYRRQQWYDETGLPWIPPSPNLRDLIATTLYPGVGMIEAAEVSVGRGTDIPFQVIGAPWLDGKALAAELTQAGIAGVCFQPTSFTPVTATYMGRLCQGVSIAIDDRDRLDTPALGLRLASALQRLGPTHFSLIRTQGSIGSAEAIGAIGSGKSAAEIMRGQESLLSRFLEIRKKYLLYR